MELEKKFAFPDSPRERKFKEINDFLRNQDKNLKINTFSFETDTPIYRNKKIQRLDNN